MKTPSSVANCQIMPNIYKNSKNRFSFFDSQMEVRDYASIEFLTNFLCTWLTSFYLLFSVLHIDAFLMRNFHSAGL